VEVESRRPMVLGIIACLAAIVRLGFCVVMVDSRNGEVGVTATGEGESENEGKKSQFDAKL
jgi:hypothetical protein